MTKIRQYSAVSLLILLVFQGFDANAENEAAKEGTETKKLDFSLTAEIVSRYVWRGQAYDLNPNIQPYFLLGYGNFSFDVWSTYSLFSGFSEIDLSLSYQAGPVTVSVMDYFYFDELQMENVNFFRNKPSDTASSSHSMEASILIENLFKTPLSFTVSTFFYGDDKDIHGKNQYSTYLEMAYNTSWENYDLSFFVGGAVNKGYYSEKAAFTNVGFSALRNITITENFDIGLSGSLIVNPYNGNAFFVLGIGL
jgi:hypothetical protein